MEVEAVVNKCVVVELVCRCERKSAQEGAQMEKDLGRDFRKQKGTKSNAKIKIKIKCRSSAKYGRRAIASQYIILHLQNG